jgi:hypothetical protein
MRRLTLTDESGHLYECPLDLVDISTHTSNLSELRSDFERHSLGTPVGRLRRRILLPPTYVRRRRSWSHESWCSQGGGLHVSAEPAQRTPGLVFVLSSKAHQRRFLANAARLASTSTNGGSHRRGRREAEAHSARRPHICEWRKVRQRPAGTTDPHRCPAGHLPLAPNATRNALAIEEMTKHRDDTGYAMSTYVLHRICVLYVHRLFGRKQLLARRCSRCLRCRTLRAVAQNGLFAQIALESMICRLNATNVWGIDAPG